MTRVLTHYVFGKRRVRRWPCVFGWIAAVQLCSRTQYMFTRALSLTSVFMHDTSSIIRMGAGLRGRMYQVSYGEAASLAVWPDTYHQC